MAYIGRRSWEGLSAKDEVLRDLRSLVTPPRPGEAARASWAAETLASLDQSCGTTLDRLALLEIADPRALEGDVPLLFAGGTYAAAANAVKSFFLTCISGCRRILPGHGKESGLEAAVLGSHTDR